MSESPKCPHCSGQENIENDVDTLGDGHENDMADACKAGAPCNCGCGKILLVVLIVVLLGFLAVGLLLPAFQGASCRGGRRMQCANDLKQIGMAMYNYQSRYGCFPPAYISDKNGKPMHSWRVLLLPFAEHVDLYKAYRFDEPWDSTANRKVAEAAAKFFQCPTARHAEGDLTTDYMMVVGPHTISDGPHSRKAKEITDGLSDTIAVVEVSDSEVPCNAPKDLQFDTMNFRINSTKRMCISSGHTPGGSNVVFCDGSARYLDDKMNPELIKAMLTIDGGEHVPRDR